MALLHDVAGCHEQFVVMSISRDIAGAVIDLDHAAVAVRSPANVTTPDATATTSEPGLPAKSAPACHAMRPGDRIDPAAETRRHPAELDRSTGERDLFVKLLIREQRREHFEFVFARLIWPANVRRRA